MSHTSSVSAVPVTSESALRAAVAELVRAGINVELVQNAVPRMYYKNQIAQHVKTKQEKDEAAGKETMGLQFHADPDECDYVLKVKDSYYDVGFIRDRNNQLIPFFDDYDHASHSVPATQTGKGPIRDFIGAAFEGKIEHWSGQRDSSEALMHSVGKLMQSYTKHAAIEAASAQGYSVLGTTTDNRGQIHITVGVN